MSDDSLDRLLGLVNRLRALDPASPRRAWLAALEARVEQFSRASCRLAVYGTLAPGGVNHGLIGGVPGMWARGTVRGIRFVIEYGPARGCPALRLDPAADLVEVWVFESPLLLSRWWRIDSFEGPAYRRVLTRVDIAAGVQVVANVYVVEPE